MGRKKYVLMFLFWGFPESYSSGAPKNQAVFCGVYEGRDRTLVLGNAHSMTLQERYYRAWPA